MKTHLITDEKSFKKIKSTWEKFYKSLDYSTPYQSWSWNYIYWKYLKRKKQLSTFIYTKNDVIVAIFPMWVRNQLGLSVLEPIGTRGTDYIHLLLDEEHAGEAVDIFLEWFKRSELEVLNLEDLPDSAFYIDILKAGISKYDLSYYFDNAYCPCFEIDLPNKWETYLEDLSKRERSDIKYYRRYAKRNSENINYLHGSSKDLDEHFQLHQKARSKKGDKGTYKDVLVRKVIVEYAVSLENEDLLELVFLEIDTKLCATVLGMELHSIKFNMTIGHDPSLSKLRPGTLLYSYDIEDCIKRGIKKYDLSRGSDSYKYKMGAKLKYNTRLVIAKSDELIERYATNQKLYWENEDYAPTEK